MFSLGLGELVDSNAWSFRSSAKSKTVCQSASKIGQKLMWDMAPCRKIKRQNQRMTIPATRAFAVDGWEAPDELDKSQPTEMNLEREATLVTPCNLCLIF